METICIIDDDKIHHFTIEKVIQLQGFTNNMLSFHDGYDAISFFHQNLARPEVLPDIIFLDLNMPVVSGWQFLQQYALIKSQIRKKIKIYVVSSSINQIEIRRVTAIEGVSGYMQKPLKPTQIQKLLSGTDVN